MLHLTWMLRLGQESPADLAGAAKVVGGLGGRGVVAGAEPVARAHFRCPPMHQARRLIGVTAGKRHAGVRIASRRVPHRAACAACQNSF